MQYLSVKCVYLIYDHCYSLLTFSNGYRIADSVEEVLKGLRCYFDKVLPVMLLYKSERQQYDEAVSDDVSPSTVYGAEHLLRLFGMIFFFCIP